MFLLRRRGGVAAIFRVCVLEMHFGDAQEIIADDLRRISAAQDQMSGSSLGPPGGRWPIIDLPVAAAERLEKVTGEGHMIGNGFGDLVRMDEICRLADLAIGRVD
jgi:hypothetical protein